MTRGFRASSNHFPVFAKGPQIFFIAVIKNWSFMKHRKKDRPISHTEYKCPSNYPICPQNVYYKKILNSKKCE